VPPFVLRHAETRNRGGVILQLCDLLFERHPRDEIGSTLLERSIEILIGGLFGKRRCRESQPCSPAQHCDFLVQCVSPGRWSRRRNDYGRPSKTNIHEPAAKRCIRMLYPHMPALLSQRRKEDNSRQAREARQGKSRKIISQRRGGESELMFFLFPSDLRVSASPRG